MLSKARTRKCVQKSTKPPLSRRQSERLSAHSRDQILLDVEKYRVVFLHTTEPWALWTAYAECRAAGLVLPEWVLRGFDDVFVRLLKASCEPDRVRPTNRTRCNKTRRRPAAKVNWTVVAASVMGFDVSNGGGRSDPFRRARDISRRRGVHDFQIAQLMRVLIDGDSHNPTNAKYLVTEELRYGLGIAISESTVWRAWIRYRKAAREISLGQTRDDVLLLGQFGIEESYSAALLRPGPPPVQWTANEILMARRMWPPLP
jgi:hypothetical protein